MIETGVINIFYDEEKTMLSEEYFQINNKKQGIYKSYYETGQLWEEVNYIDDKREEIYKSYYETGQL